jgi:protein-S-isoprenylcysteine O-methyltransferase Ste14
MTAWGVGPLLASISLAYLAFAVILHSKYPDIMLMTRDPHIVFPIAGTVLIACGVAMWALGFRIIDKAFHEGELLTRGVYSIVRHPMYSGLIIFLAPGVALLCRSWALLTVPVFAYVAFKVLIKREEDYLEKKFGQAYLDYTARVNAIVPFFRFRK